MTITERAWYVYALIDPRTDEVRYVGVTVDPVKRYSDHIYQNNQREVYKYRWICVLRNLGLKPRMLILETGTGQESRIEAERWWISHLRRQGERLTNITEGGDGAPGYNPPPDTRERMSIAAKNRPPRPLEIRMKQGAALRGKKRPPEVVAKITAARTPHRWTEGERKRLSESVRNSGFRHTPEMIQKIAAANTGRKHTPEAIEKQRAAKIGKPLTAEHRAKLSAAKKGRVMPEGQKEHIRQKLTGVPQRCGLCGQTGHKRSTCQTNKAQHDTDKSC